MANSSSMHNQFHHNMQISRFRLHIVNHHMITLSHILHLGQNIRGFILDLSVRPRATINTQTLLNESNMHLKVTAESLATP